MTKTIIIAEAGVNHNGSINIAKKLVNVAKEAGADFVKFQLFIPEKLVTNYAKKAKYQKISNDKKNTQLEMLKNLNLDNKAQTKILDYCKKKKIGYLCTAFDDKSFEFILKKKLKFIKIPSGEIDNFVYLKKLKKINNKNIILSSGASNFLEVKRAINIIGKKNLILLQCNSAYPTPLQDLNLKTLLLFKKKFKIRVGLSDHSLSLIAPSNAVAMGASLIEKHFTLSRKMKGPDHKSSLEPKELKQMIEYIRETEISLGLKKKFITKSEKKNRIVIRKSIVAASKIKKGSKFTKNNITVKRPGSGLSPMKFFQILGKKSKRNYKIDDLIFE